MCVCRGRNCDPVGSPILTETAIAVPTRIMPVGTAIAEQSYQNNLTIPW